MVSQARPLQTHKGRAWSHGAPEASQPDSQFVEHLEHSLPFIHHIGCLLIRELTLNVAAQSQLTLTKTHVSPEERHPNTPPPLLLTGPGARTPPFVRRRWWHEVCTRSVTAPCVTGETETLTTTRPSGRRGEHDYSCPVLLFAVTWPPGVLSSILKLGSNTQVFPAPQQEHCGG